MHNNTPAAVALLLSTHASTPCEGDTFAPVRAAVTSFQSFFAHACHAGLGVVRGYDAPVLLEYAEQALVLEQKLATGCFLLQAVLLVEYFVRTTTCPSEQELRAQDFGQDTGGEEGNMLPWLA